MIDPRILTPLFSERGATEKELERISDDWIDQLAVLSEWNSLECSYDEQGALRYKLIEKGA